jgi:hypothetical protein
MREAEDFVETPSLDRVDDLRALDEPRSEDWVGEIPAR